MMSMRKLGRVKLGPVRGLSTVPKDSQNNELDLII